MLGDEQAARIALADAMKVAEAEGRRKDRAIAKLRTLAGEAAKATEVTDELTQLNLRAGEEMVEKMTIERDAAVALAKELEVQVELMLGQLARQADALGEVAAQVGELLLLCRHQHAAQT